MTERESLDARRDGLSPRQRALLAARLARATTTPAPSAIPRRPDPAVAPMSSAQERLWFLDEFESQPDVYNRPANLRLEGGLDVAALRRALDGLAARHEVLRARFPEPGDDEVVRIVPAEGLPFREVDLRGLPEGMRLAEARRLLDEENLEAFDLQHGPPARACLIRVADAEHWLALTFHHIAFDGWSEAVLWRDLGTLYSAHVAGVTPSLPDLAVSYGDFAAWQRGRAADPAVQREVAYWKDRLAGSRPDVGIPTDFPRPKVLGNRGAFIPVRIGGPVVEALAALAREEGATLFMALLAAFQALLARHSGQEDISVGTPVAGRLRPELEGLIGCFINTLVLRTDLSGDPAFRTLLARVRDASLGAFAHQELPFERLVEVVNPGRRLDRSPLFESMVVLLNTPREPLRMAGLRATPIEYRARSAKYGLSLALKPDGPGLSGVLEYNTELFRAGTIEALAARLHVLLQGVVADPGRPVSRLPLLPDAERRRVLLE